VSGHLLSDALSLLLAKRANVASPPLVLGELPTLPLVEQAEIAFLLAELGELEYAKKIVARLLALAAFPTLWSSESQYDGSRTHLLLDLLQQRPCNVCDDYLAFFLKHIPALFGNPALDRDVFLTTSADRWEMAIAQRGQKMPLGAWRTPEISIPAFGFQADSLSDASLFGVDRFGDPSGWSRISAAPKLWVQIMSVAPLSVFVPEFLATQPMYIVFYVQAEKARVGSNEYKPKSLQRFMGVEKAVVFTALSCTVQIIASVPMLLSVVPLAGNTSYWGATFLVAFELTPGIKKFYISSGTP
jgi:hypothetical protein